MIYKCVYCGGEFDERQIHFHHIIPRRIWPEEEGNHFKVPACIKGLDDCHNRLTKIFIEEGEIWLPNGKILVVKK